MEYIRNIKGISIKIMIQHKKHGTQTQWGGREADASLGAPPESAPLCSLFLIILYHKYSWMTLVYSCILLID